MAASRIGTTTAIAISPLVRLSMPGIGVAYGPGERGRLGTARVGMARVEPSRGCGTNSGQSLGQRDIGDEP